MPLFFGKQAKEYAQGLFGWAQDQSKAKGGKDSRDGRYYAGVSLGAMELFTGAVMRPQIGAQLVELGVDAQMGYDDAAALLMKVKRQKKIPSMDYADALNEPHSQAL